MFTDAMFTDDDVSRLYSSLSQDQIGQVVYYFSKEGLPEFKKMIQSKVKSRFVLSMRRSVAACMRKLEKKDSVRAETKNLLKHTVKTLRHVHVLIRNCDIIDANVLLRSAFENLIMAVMINENEDIYNEFIDLSIDENTRNYTKPQRLRKGFRKVLKKIDNDVFSDISYTRLQDLLDELYDKMCLYTHSTVVVNALTSIDDNSVAPLFVIFAKQNAYFIEFLLYLCSRYLVGVTTKNKIMLYALIGWVMSMLDAADLKFKADDFNQIYDKLYGNTANNDKFLTKYDKYFFDIKDGLYQMKNSLQNNAGVLIDLLIEIMK